MKTSCFVSSFVAAAVNGISMDSDVGVNLLQHRFVHHHKHNSSLSQNPGQRERQMCPHEIEEMKKNTGSPFGCRGKLYAPSTKECSWWGDPHVSATFPSQIPASGTHYDVIYKPGHFRMAMAKDKSWEIQVFNCGIYSSAIAGRFGKDIIEFHASPQGLQRYVNGKLQSDFPVELPSGVYMDDKHRQAKSNNYNDPSRIKTGACVDDGNSGQVYFEVGAGGMYPSTQNLNVLIRAADGSFTTVGEDPLSFCNKVLTPHAYKWANWNLAYVKAEESIFTIGQKMCEACNTYNWWRENPQAAKNDCAGKSPVDFDIVSRRETCQAKNIDLQTAKDACVHLKDNEEFFIDCQVDYCASGGDVAAVGEAEDELANEHPAPKCVKEGADCDPAKICCDAKKDKKTLDLGNVGTNNLCGDDDGKQELRFTSVLAGVDLVVKPTGEFKCTQGVTNAKNGVDGKFGVITLPVGTETEFEFTYVNSGTDSPKDVGSQPFSFLDVDQGKKGRQRESVEVCGASNAIVTTNSELEQSTSGNCIKVTSTTRGKGDDNPDDPDNMSDIQRARTAAFTASGSSFLATLGVSAKGRHARKFMFSGSPTIACDALAE